MPVFTSIGTALGASAASAFAVGLGTTAIATGAAVAGGMALGSQGGSKKTDSGPAGVDPSIGALSEAEAQAAAKKRLFRSGVMFSGTSGLGSGETLGQGRLK